MEGFKKVGMVILVILALIGAGTIFLFVACMVTISSLPK